MAPEGLFEFAAKNAYQIYDRGNHGKDDAVLEEFLNGGLPDVHKENGNQKQDKHPVKECPAGNHYPHQKAFDKIKGLFFQIISVTAHSILRPIQRYFRQQPRKS